MSGTYRSASRSSASGRIKTENPALVKLLTSDSLTKDTRFVDTEHTSHVNSPHASTNLTSKQATVNKIDSKCNSRSNSAKNISVENRPSSRYSVTDSSDKENINQRPNSRYSEKDSVDKLKTDSRPISRYSLKNTSENTDSDKRPSSRFSETDERRPDSRFSVKSDKADKQRDNSNNSSWGNDDESLTFDINNVNNNGNPDIDRESEKSTTPTNKVIDDKRYSDVDNSVQDRYTDKLHSSDSIKQTGDTPGKNTPSKIDYLQVQRIESPAFERSRSRESKSPSGNSQNYSYNRLKNSNTSTFKQHPALVARSASQLIDAHSGEGFEADSLDIDSGLVPDTASLLETTPDTGRQTHRVTTPVTKNVPVIKSADSSRFRANSRTSQRSLSANSATGVPSPQLDRNESVISDNGIPPPSNIQYNLPSNSIEEVNEDNLSASKRFDQRKSAVSFKEPVISDYHSHIETQDDWDTPRERVPTPHPSSPKRFQDSLDFGGRSSNLSPEPIHQTELDIPSVLDSQAFASEPVHSGNSAKSGRSVKKVYIDSPTFTKEEEEEFRFVESRIDEMNDDLEDTVKRIEEQGNRYRQEREAMNEEAARLRAEIQATEGYSNSYNSRNTSDRYGQRDNYSDNYSKPITHPSDEMESRSYGRPQDQDSDYRQDGYQNGVSNNSHSYGGMRDSRDVYNARINDRYEDRNVEHQEGYSRNMGGYSQEQEGYARNHGGYSQNQGAGDQNGYSQDQDRHSRRPDDQYSGQQEDQYRHRQDERYGHRQDDQYYDRRGDSPSRFQIGNEKGDDDLQKETEYQEDLRHRVESNLKHDSELVIPRIPVEDNQYRDSLDENGYNDQRYYMRDSLEPEGYGNWGNPPPNPFGQGHGQNAGYLDENRPDYVDDEDTARMELVHPKEPRVDYVEENKVTYGLPPSKSYKTLKIKEKEAEQKLTDIFIHPKKTGKKHKRTIPLTNEERQPPLSELKNNEIGAEGVWAKRSAQLAKHKDGKSTASGSIKKSRGLQKYPSDGVIRSGQGQTHHGQGRMYGTPTRNQYLEPLGYKPQLSKDEPQQSPVYRDTGSYKKPIELEPIKTEITTDDGQKISVDINLKVLSPTLQRRIRSHPDDSVGSVHPYNVHAEVVQKQPGDRHAGRFQPLVRQGGGDQAIQHSDRHAPMRQSPHNSLLHSEQNSQQGSRHHQDNQYQRQNQVLTPEPNDASHNQTYRTNDLPAKYHTHDFASHNQPYRSNDYDGIDEEALRKQEEALMAELNLSPNPYAKIPPIPIRDELTVPVIVEKGGYAAMYQETKNKDPDQQPWYQVYTLNDFKKMQKEVRLNRGTLGPDLDNETYKDKLEKRHKQFEYARMVMEKNKHELHDKKPPYPRKDPQVEENEKSKRKAQDNRTRKALDYAKNVPKPAVKARPTQYNSYEVASQLSPIAKQGTKSPTHTQQVDVVNLKKLQQRHEQEKKNVAMMRQNMETVPQKA